MFLVILPTNRQAAREPAAKTVFSPEVAEEKWQQPVRQPHIIRYTQQMCQTNITVCEIDEIFSLFIRRRKL